MLVLNLWKKKKGKTLFYGFIEIVNESNCKPSKLWVDQGKEFYNNFIQKGLDDNDILMYLIMEVNQKLLRDL